MFGFIIKKRPKVFNFSADIDNMSINVSNTKKALKIIESIWFGLMVSSIFFLVNNCVEKKSSENGNPSSVNSLEKYFPKAAPPTGQKATTDGLSSSEGVAEDDAPVKLIEISCAESFVVVGNSKPLRAIAILQDQRKKDITKSVTWAVDHPEFADFSVEGMPHVLQAISSGIVRVTATFGDVSGFINLTIKETSIAKIEITPKMLVFGVTQQFFATCIYDDNTTEDLTDKVQWSSSNSLIAEADTSTNKKGLFIGKSPGTVNIVAKYNGNASSAPITVKMLKLTSIEIEKSSETVMLGSKVNLKAIGHFENGSTNDVTSALNWSSGNEEVATVDNVIGQKGVVLTKGVGPVTITGSYGTASGQIELLVTSESFASLVITPTNSKVPKGLEKPFKLIGTYPDGTTQDVTKSAVWSSSMPLLGSVSNDTGKEGYVKAWEIGSIILTASYGQQSAETVIELTAAALMEIEVTSNKTSVNCGVEVPEFYASGLYSDEQTSNLTDLVTWSVEFPDLASVSNDAATKGKLTTTGPGTTKVFATMLDPTLGAEIVGSKAIIIDDPIMDGFDIQSELLSMPVGTKTQLVAIEGYTCPKSPPIYVTNTVTWSSDSSYAQVSNEPNKKGLLATGGAVTSITKVNISVEKNGLTGTIELEIRPKEVVTLRIGSPVEATDVRSSTQLTAAAVYSDETVDDMTVISDFPGYTLDWSVANPTIATINNDDQKGLISGIVEGIAVVSAVLTTPSGKIINGIRQHFVQSVCTTGTRSYIYCWFLSDLNQSCVDVCTAVGGTYHSATVNYAGSNGRPEWCARVLRSLDPAYEYLQKDGLTGPDNQGVGCAILDAYGATATRRYTTPDTTAEALHPLIRRACSCAQ